MANREACEVYIDQQIEEGLEEGKTPYSIGQEVSGWIAKLFETKIKPTTIEKRAERARKTFPTFVGSVPTTQDDSIIEPIQTKPVAKDGTFRGGQRDGSGPKQKYQPEAPRKLQLFNRTNDNIEWAKWTWNPVTGCKHGCQYCYARDIANRFYKEKFEPTFRPERLFATTDMKDPAGDDIGERNVFVCSMADLFGDWVPDEWIDAVLETIQQAPKWNFIFLTKNPKRLVEIEWPGNAWVGTTVDTQARVQPAEQAFKEIEARVKFVSCEPLSEPIHFDHLDYFDWLIIGSRSRSSGMDGMVPELGWMADLYNQCAYAGVIPFTKPNAMKVIQNYPR